MIDETPETKPRTVKAKPEDQPVNRRSELALKLKGGGISSGDRGHQVEIVQKALLTLGFYDGPADGRYGIVLTKAVRQFQSANNLRITGDVNVATWERLFASIESETHV